MAQSRESLSRLLRTMSIPIAVVCMLAVSIMYLADAYLRHSLDMTITQEAEDRAANWGNELLARPGVMALFTGDREAVPEYLARLQATSAKNGFLHFQLFSPKGALIVDLDRALFDMAADLTITNPVADEVFARGDAVSTLNRVAEGEATLVETYVPATDAMGRRFGVIRMVVDASAISNNLTGMFERMSHLLIFGTAVVYLIPSLVLIFKAEQLRAKDQVLLELSLIDSLTGQLNRREFTARSEAAFHLRKDTNIGLLFFDVDHFKSVNDELGHDFGDALLRHVAAMIRSVVGPDDLVGRIGGDEFMIVLPDATAETLLDLGLAIQAAMDKPFSHKGTTILPRLSIGAHLSPPGETRADAIQAADLATYRAKAMGRARLVLYQPEMGADQTRRRYVEAALRRALAEDQGFFVEYQPIFGGGDRAVRGFEALLRLRDDHGALIPPGEFIPIAEDSGLIVEIGKKTLIRVLAVAATWPAPLFAAVNLSAVQFKEGDLVPFVRDALRQAAFDPARLELEVTESLILDYASEVNEQLAGLKALGVSISLDDFGTGYSSLGYLSKYRFDKIKIDRAFLEGFDLASDSYRKVIGTIVMLGRNLGMQVTAEGIEGPHQLAMLADLGCDQFQGFLLGRPMSEAAAAALAGRPQAERAAG